VGMLLGSEVGPTIGTNVAEPVGMVLGSEVGPPEWAKVGELVGILLGSDGGPTVGTNIGEPVGMVLGSEVGSPEWAKVGEWATFGLLLGAPGTELGLLLGALLGSSALTKVREPLGTKLGELGTPVGDPLILIVGTLDIPLGAFE